VSVLVFVIGVLLVGGLLFLGASVLLGRGETQPPAELDHSPLELPDDRPVLGDDVRGLRLSVAFRGYRMTEVDWLLDQLAQVLDDRDEALAALDRAGAGGCRAAHGATAHRSNGGGPGSADVEDTDPHGVPVPTPQDEERPGA
jgi:DivIVA domain-containing protein